MAHEFVSPKIEVRDMGTETTVKRSAKLKHGRHHNGATVPAEHVLRMRRMYEVEGKSLARVKAEYPQYSESYIRSVLQYVVRADLRVK